MILKTNGEERMRITSSGGNNIPVYRAGIDINGVKIVYEEMEAEQTDVPSEQPVNWFNKLKTKIKNGYERITTKKDIQ